MSSLSSVTTPSTTTPTHVSALPSRISIPPTSTYLLAHVYFLAAATRLIFPPSSLPGNLCSKEPQPRHQYANPIYPNPDQVMDEKRVRDMSPIRLGRATSRRQLPSTILAVTLITMSLYAWSHLAGLTQLATGHQWQQPVQPVVNMNTLVPLEAHIMSKCGDAKDCLKYMVLPAMQRVYDKVNFTLSFIGTPTENDGVACRHGPEECLGNIIELCAQKLYPDPKTYLGFTMCLTKDYDMIPQRSLVEDCALEHAIDFDKLNECATKDDGAFGMGMLRGSVKRSSDAGVTKSCTVRLDEKVYCVRDNSEWKDCPSGAGVNDLVIAVEKLYRRS